MQHQLCSSVLFKHLNGKKFKLMKFGSKVELYDSKWVAGKEVNEWKGCQICRICRPAMGRSYEQGTAAPRPAKHRTPDM